MRRHLGAHGEDVLAQFLGIAGHSGDLAHDRLDPPARRIRSGHHAAAHQRHVFPGPGILALIAGKAVDPHRQRPLRPLGPQPGIDLVKGPLGGRHAERGADALGEAIEIERPSQRTAPVRFRSDRAVREQVDDVEIGRMSQRPTTQAPEAEHHQLAIDEAAVSTCEFLLRRIACDVQRRLGHAGQGARRIECDVQRRLGHAGQGARHIERVLLRLDQLHAQRKALLARHHADAIELAFVIVPALAPRHPVHESRDIAGKVEGRAIDQRVE